MNPSDRYIGGGARDGRTCDVTCILPHPGSFVRLLISGDTAVDVVAVNHSSLTQKMMNIWRFGQVVS